MKGEVVYLHRNAFNGEVFYVGKGANRGRAYEEYNRSKEWNDIVNEFYFDVEILAHSISIEEAFELEEFIISFIGIKNLTNKTLGGLGIKGFNHTNETKKIISESMGLRAKDDVDKAVAKSWKTKHSKSLYSYIHINTREVVNSLSDACKKYNVSYKLEWQRQYRNSENKVFNKVLRLKNKI